MQLPENNVVSMHWLKQNMAYKKLRVLFTQMANPVSNKIENIPPHYIPNSILFDYENVFCDTSSSLPHTMPSTEVFAQEARKLGINSDSVIVIYDAVGLYCAPRAWWMFKSMGHDKVFVLDGGLPEWLANDFDTDDKLALANSMGEFSANYKPRFFVDAEYILHHKNAINLIDARSSGRFNGSSPEPRQGLRSGHAPGAINLPFEHCVEKGRIRSSEQLKKLFSALPLTNSQSFVFSCGSGVTACILALAASELGYKNLAVYDGSWSEWGGRIDLPVERD